MSLFNLVACFWIETLTNERKENAHAQSGERQRETGNWETEQIDWEWMTIVCNLK